MAIIVLSLNTAVDRTVLVPGFRAGEIARAERSGAFAGGKALNVARVLRQLGEPVRVIGFLGGVAAPFIRARCEELGIEQRWVQIVGETRTCVIVVDPEYEQQTVVNEPGPRITPAEVGELRGEIARSVSPGDTVCMSGSAPPGVPDGFYAEIADGLRRRDARVLADLTGTELAAVAEMRPWALAPNLDEATAAFGPASQPEDMVHRMALCTEHAMLTLGADGVLYTSGQTCVELHPPAVGVVNAVGSGDAFAAGFLAGMARGLSGVEAVRLGVACGASNAARFEPGIGSLLEIQEIFGSLV